jgi:hypothetical protein
MNKAYHQGIRRLLIRICCVGMLGLGSLQSAEPTVGIESAVEVLLPGTMLQAKTPERNAPVNVRIASTRPHGTLISYDLRYVGLVPGQYDLRPYLFRQDGSSADDLPPIMVAVRGLLPPDHLGELPEPPTSPFAFLGGYRIAMGVLAVGWVLAAVPLIMMRRRRGAQLEPAAVEAPPTLIDRLRPLVQKAGAGTLDTAEKAKLESLLLAHWRERLELEDLSAAEALAVLRQNPEAGALLRTLEDWLHRRPGTAQVDVESALAPYAVAANESPQPVTANTGAI